MNAIALLRDQYRAAHAWLEQIMQDVTPEQAHWSPLGTANPLGASYVHVIVGEDVIVNSVLQGHPPLFVTTWAGKTGISEPMPPGLDWGDWARRVQLDLGAVRQYAQEVCAATDEYLASLGDDRLEREVQFFNLGQQTEAKILSDLLAHVRDHCGEISCLKGIQGGRGYPE